MEIGQWYVDFDANNALDLDFLDGCVILSQVSSNYTIEFCLFSSLPPKYHNTKESCDRQQGVEHGGNVPNNY